MIRKNHETAISLRNRWGSTLGKYWDICKERHPGPQGPDRCRAGSAVIGNNGARQSDVQRPEDILLQSGDCFRRKRRGASLVRRFLLLLCLGIFRTKLKSRRIFDHCGNISKYSSAFHGPEAKVSRFKDRSRIIPVVVVPFQETEAVFPTDQPTTLVRSTMRFSAT